MSVTVEIDSVPVSRTSGRPVDPLQRARDVGVVFNATMAESERLTTLAPAAVQALRDSRLHNYLLAPEVGGEGGDLLTYIEVVEELSRNDPAGGWAFMTSAASGAALSAFIGDAAANDLFSRYDIVMPAGLLGPAGTAKKVDGGFLVSGTYSFGSGSGHANVIVGGAIVDGDMSNSIVFNLPKEQVEMLGNWNTLGLKGTGSYDYRVPETLVSEDSVFYREGATPLRGQPTLGFGLFPLGLAGHTGVALGTMKRALEELAALANADKGAVPMSQNAKFLSEFGELDGKYRALRAYFFSITAELLASLDAGIPLDSTQMQAYRQAGNIVIHDALQVVLGCYLNSSSRGIRDLHPLGKITRDMLVQVQHALVNPRVMIPAGASALAAYAVA